MSISLDYENGHTFKDKQLLFQLELILCLIMLGLAAKVVIFLRFLMCLLQASLTFTWCFPNSLICFFLFFGSHLCFFKNVLIFCPSAPVNTEMMKMSLMLLDHLSLFCLLLCLVCRQVSNARTPSRFIWWLQHWGSEHGRRFQSGTECISNK